MVSRSSRPEVFLAKGVLKICSKFTGEHPCRSVILLCNFIEIALQHGCSPVNLLHIFRKPFPRNTTGWLLLGIKQGSRSVCKKRGEKIIADKSFFVTQPAFTCSKLTIETLEQGV